MHMVKHDWQQGLDACHSAGRVWVRFGLFFQGMRRVITADHVHYTLPNGLPQRILMPLLAHRRVHLGQSAQALIALRCCQGQVMGGDFHAAPAFVPTEILHFLCS